MNRRAWFVLSISAGLSLSTLAAPVVGTKAESGNADLGLGPYKGLKHAIGVKNFDNEAGWSGMWKLGDNLSLMLESALFDSGRFVIVQREKLQDVIGEQNLANSGRAAKASDVAQTGKIRLAKYIAGGAITEVSENKSGGDGGISIKGFRIGASKETAQIALVVTLTDTSTGEIVAKERVVGKAGSAGLSLGYTGNGLNTDLGGFARTPLGEAAQDCVNQAAKFIALKMKDMPFEGNVVKVGKDGKIIINRGSEFGVQVGQTLTMTTVGEELVDPATGEVLGKEEGESIGTIKVARVDEKISYCDPASGEAQPAAGTLVRATP